MTDKERKQQRSVSILPSVEIEVMKKHKSWTRYLEKCLKRDGFTKQLTTKTK